MADVMEESGLKKGGGWRSFLAAILLFTAFDLAFMAPAIFDDSQRAAWDAMTLRQPIVSEMGNAKEIPRSHMRADWSRQFAPWAKQVRASWLQLKAPLWDEYSGLGKPLAGNVQCEAFSPYLPLNLIGGQHFWDLKQFFVILLAQIFTFMAARALGMRTWPAIAAGLAFSFCSFIQTWILHPHSGVAAFYPLLAWTFIKLRQTGAARWVGASALALGLSVLAGHVETVAILGIGASVFGFFLSAGHFLTSRIRFFFQVMAVVVLGGLFSSVMLVPFGEYLLESSVIEKRQSILANHGIGFFAIQSWENFLTIFDPDIFGDHLDHRNYRGEGSFIETGFFMGSAVLVFAFIGGLASLRRQTAVVISATLTIALGFLLSLNVGPVQEYLGKVPLLGEMPARRYPFMGSLPVALLAGLGLNALYAQRQKAILVLQAVLVIGFVALPFLIQHYLPNLEFAPKYPTKTLIWTISAAALVLLSGLFAQEKKRIVFPILACILIGVESDLRWRHELPVFPAKHSLPQVSAMATLKECSKTGRVLPYVWALPPEQHTNYDIKSTRSYDAIAPRRFQELIRRSGHYGLVDDPQLTIGMNRGMMDMMSIQWILSSVRPARMLQPKGLQYLDAGVWKKFECELSPGQTTDFSIGPFKKSNPLTGYNLRISSGETSWVYDESAKDATPWDKLQVQAQGLGYVHTKADRTLDFIKRVLPRCEAPRTLTFKSTATSKKKFTFEFMCKGGVGSVRRLVPDQDGPKKLFRNLPGGNAIFFRPTALPFAYWAPHIVPTTDEEKTLQFIWSDKFDPNRHTLVELDGVNWKGFNAQVLPEAIPVQIERKSAEEITAEVETPLDRLLVFTENKSSGWRAFVDDVQVPIVYVNHTVMGVPVRAGKHKVRLVYRPRFFDAAIVLTLMSFVACIALIGRRPEQSPERLLESSSS